MNRKTLGLWAVTFPADGFTTRHPLISADYGHVARAEWQGDVQSTNANAQLIAAAPDLLAALEALNAAVIKAGHGNTSMPELTQAWAAIARATGGQE